MKSLRVLGVLSVFVLVACTQVNSKWNLESQGDLAGRRAFALRALAEKPGEFSNASEADWKRRQDLVRTLILTELTNKGYRLSSSRPDFIVEYAAGVDLKDGAFTTSDGVLQGEVDIHAVDPTSNRWLWHGWATETITSKLDRDAEVRKAVAEILAKFPPAS